MDQQVDVARVIRDGRKPLTDCGSRNLAPVAALDTGLAQRPLDPPGNLLGRPELRGKTQLVVDATGVGRPVVDMLRAGGLDLVAVTITAGDTAHFDKGFWRVPKRELVSTAQVLLQGQRLEFAQGVPYLETLVKELLAFRVTISTNAHDRYGAWREQDHDDLVLAV
ncbi:MAG TPA: hypothetical protein VER55_11035, partial [Ardenticatenaceae bacterium]|nr:hypothetical protein [Ardenticatenaceae bacterium]